MTSAVLADPATRQAAGPQGRLARWAVPLVPAAAALALALTYIGRPAFWLDESATISATGRPVGEMLRLFQHLDLVHAFYYLAMKVWIAVFGNGETALRLPSALATAAAAAGIAVIGRRCAGRAAGLLAGLAYAGSIPVATYAHEARSYAMVAAVAVLATYLLIRGVHPREPHPWRWFAGYGAAILVLGLLHLDSVLLLAAHGATLLIARAKAPRTWLRWTVCGGLGGALLVPLALAAQTQSVQVAWLPRPSWPLVWQLVKFLTGGRDLVWPTLAAALIGACVGVKRRGAEGAGGSEEDASTDGCSISLTVLALPWLIVPSALLLLASLVADPMFIFRYVLFSVPALTLLMGAGLARIAALGRPWLGGLLLAAAVAVLAVPAVQPQTALRRHDSKLDDMRTPAQVVRREAHKGDAIIYINGVARWDAAAYPDAFGRLRDIGMAEDPVHAGNFEGRDKLPWQLRGPLIHSERVWLLTRARAVNVNPGPLVFKRMKMIDATGPWRIAGNWRFKGGALTLYVRTGPYRSPSARGTAGKPQRAVPKPRSTTAPKRAVPKPRRTAPAKP
ncbi:glycosyltransferase family 39 protein [Actinomadura violacea]|uniref:Glycosyltransferase family 39 protein n=1 Tax=Actinomadura violacea TaxID=2819934 RepID=A0ABS3RTX6_9ACTN|nr:glycosyltransferase family 39 protein [Actinomadura violacea]MBO2460204.1 glycosyltransferase family 39 protein [Actinomadura violacea]